MRLSPRQRWIDFAATSLAALYVWFTLQPDLLLSPTTANGGDTGAHVWWPAYLRDHVLPKWRLSGWAPDWYAGFPAGHFYFPLPSLLVVLGDLVLPYNVAFKLVTALGPVMLPVAAYFFARGIGARWPAPPLFAVATLPYLFFTGYTIYGGNLASTLAGEFSFTIALCLALFFLGALARALDERTSFVLPTVLLAATVMSHIIVAFFAVIAALVIWLQRRPRENFSVAAAIGGVAALLTAVWTVPLVLRLGYATDMGWTKLCGPEESSVGSCMMKNLLPPDLRWVFLLAGVGVIAGLGFRRRSTTGLVVLAVIFALAFVKVPETRLWNARLLPFYYLTVMFLAAIGVAELASAFSRMAHWALRTAQRVGPALRRRWRPVPDGELAPVDPAAPAGAQGEAETEATADVPAETVAAPVAEPAAETVAAPAAEPAAGAAAGAAPPEEGERGFEFPSLVIKAVAVFVALGFAIGYTHETRSFLPAWIRWNYSGYEAKPAYPEFREVIQTMAKLPPGRALWEPSSGIDKYGTTLALELLPHFTDGRIGSMEGLYFESAATTPYHFMMVAALAKQPSNPVRGLKYRTIADFDIGVQQMRLMGVRYYMAQSDEAKAAADNHPSLQFVAETGSPSVTPQVARWRIYEVLDAPLVEGLANEPVVVTGVSTHGWLKPASAWFDDPGAFDRLIAANGPESWARATQAAASGEPRRPLPEVKVSRIESGDDWIRFRVSRPGVPVLVKTSYFPNWKVDGARGPWRVSPNLMVVIPTSTNVSMHYGRTPADFAGIGLTGLGIAGLVFLARWRPGPLGPRRRKEDERPAEPVAGPPDSPDEAERSPAMAYD